MNFISLSAAHLVWKQNEFTSIQRFSSKTSQLATRTFTQKSVENSFPLHDAVEKGNKDLVVKVLKFKRPEINGFNEDGELPITIAAKKFAKDKKISSEIAEIIKILHDNGACFLYDNKKGETALHYFLEVKNSKMKKLVPRNVSIEEIEWNILTGKCNALIRCIKIGCPNECPKDCEEM